MIHLQLFLTADSDIEGSSLCMNSSIHSGLSLLTFSRTLLNSRKEQIVSKLISLLVIFNLNSLSSILATAGRFKFKIWNHLKIVRTQSLREWNWNQTTIHRCIKILLGFALKAIAWTNEGASSSKLRPGIFSRTVSHLYTEYWRRVANFQKSLKISRVKSAMWAWKLECKPPCSKTRLSW